MTESELDSYRLLQMFIQCQNSNVICNDHMIDLVLLTNPLVLDDLAQNIALVILTPLYRYF